MAEPTSSTGAAGAALVAIGVSLVGSKYGPLATVAAGLRGQVCLEKGGAGVADVAYVCRKNAADTYEWQALA